MTLRQRPSVPSRAQVGPGAGTGYRVPAAALWRRIRAALPHHDTLPGPLAAAVADVGGCLNSGVSAAPAVPRLPVDSTASVRFTAVLAPGAGPGGPDTPAGDLIRHH